ncbi:uncharacterized protein At4g15970-like [Typha latifolia]|uniref:uncharacterized protein At4g15970-like n=1 Tax=Typha latifolia TaxID=4733 RepID=UPI003C2E5D23
MAKEMKNFQPMVSILLCAATATVIILFYLSANSDMFVWNSATQMISSHVQDVNITKIMDPVIETEFQDLLPLLERAAMDDKTVILTEVNEAWAAPNSLLDAFLESFRIGERIGHLLKHVIVIAMDAKAFDRCKSLHSHCYMLNVKGINLNSEKLFMSKDFLELVWSKVRLQQSVLELGYNFLFSDVDVVWFRSPFQHINANSDIVLSCDKFFGNPEDLWNFPNTGFIYMKSNRKNIEALKYWNQARKKFPTLNEQRVFNEIKREIASQLQVRMQFVDSAVFGGFCDPARDLNKICTMHAACCVGVGAKLHDLRSVLDDWRKYTALPVEEREKGGFTWTVPGICIH